MYNTILMLPLLYPCLCVFLPRVYVQLLSSRDIPQYQVSLDWNNTPPPSIFFFLLSGSPSPRLLLLIGHSSTILGTWYKIKSEQKHNTPTKRKIFSAFAKSGDRGRGSRTEILEKKDTLQDTSCPHCWLGGLGVGSPSLD